MPSQKTMVPRLLAQFVPAVLIAAAALAGCGSDAGVEQGRSDNVARTDDTVTDDTVTGDTETDDTETDATGGNEPDSTIDPEATTATTATQATTESSAAPTTAVVEGSECPAEDGSSSPVGQFPAPPPMCIDPARSYVATLTTNIGVMTLTLDAAAAPLTVNNFVFLARYHYFDETTCHRIITGFVFQCGDPTATGSGGPGYEFPDELPAPGQYRIGSLAMANAGPDTNGSQFFVITGDQGVSLPPAYTLFGQVTAGLDVVSAIDALGSNSGQPVSPVDIESVTIAAS